MMLKFDIKFGCHVGGCFQLHFIRDFTVAGETALGQKFNRLLCLGHKFIAAVVFFSLPNIPCSVPWWPHKQCVSADSWITAQHPGAHGW